MAQTVFAGAETLAGETICGHDDNPNKVATSLVYGPILFCTPCHVEWQAVQREFEAGDLPADGARQRFLAIGLDGDSIDGYFAGVSADG